MNSHGFKKNSFKLCLYFNFLRKYGNICRFSRKLHIDSPKSLDKYRIVYIMHVIFNDKSNMLDGDSRLQWNLNKGFYSEAYFVNSYSIRIFQIEKIRVMNV